MNYTGISIGPTFGTLNKAHKTRELWFASYWLSNIAKGLIDKLKLIEGVNFIVPYPEKEIDITNPYGSLSNRVGVFPDRIIIHTTDSIKVAVDEIIAKQKEEEAIMMNLPNADKYLDSYLRIIAVEGEFMENDNVVFKLNQILANLELNNSYIPIDENLIETYLHNVTKTKTYKDLFNIRFPSIIEIATNGLDHPDGIFDYENHDDDEDDQFWNKILAKAKEEKNEENPNPRYFTKLKVPHKYFAIIEADGDNFGKILSEIYKKDRTLVQNFSKAISKFSIEATRLINKRKGFPVYAGGDDLFWFQPILINSSGDGVDSFLKLILCIDELLEKIFTDDMKLKEIYQSLCNNPVTKPTISYGISISYYKYPLHESKEMASDNLIKIKKSSNGIKNKIGIRITKHSGQSETLELNKSLTKSFSLIESLIGEKSGLAFNSVLYNIEKFEIILSKLIQEKRSLTHFFKNMYNEAKHVSEYHFFLNIEKILKSLFEEKVLMMNLLVTKNKQEGNNEATIKKQSADFAIKTVRDVLYFIKFINQDELN